MVWELADLQKHLLFTIESGRIIKDWEFIAIASSVCNSGDICMQQQSGLSSAIVNIFALKQSFN